MRRKIISGVVAMMALALWAMPGQAAGEPDSVLINTLSQYYEPVAFDHAGHVDMAGDCAGCHHHTTGAPTSDPACARCHDSARPAASVACRDCHVAQPFSAEALREKEADVGRYHTDKPGLRGAYHASCMGCHEANGGPVGCEDCHPRTDAGDALYRTGPYAPAGGTASAEH